MSRDHRCEIERGRRNERNRNIWTLAAGEFVVAYLVNDGLRQSPSSFRRLVDGKTEMPVPAGSLVVPAVARKGALVSLGEPVRLKAGERRAVPRIITSRDSVDVVVALSVEPEDLVPGESDPTPPLVALRAGDSAWAPSFPLRHFPAFAESLVIFRGVPRRAGVELSVSSPTWSDAKRDLDALATSRSGVVDAGVVTVSRTASARVEWNLEVGAELIPEVSCKPYEPEVAARLLRCSDDGCGTVATASVRTREVRGVLDLETESGGEMKLELNHPVGGRVTQNLALVRGNVVTVPMSVKPATISGRVRIDGRPVRAQVRFAAGPRGVSSETTGEYVAIFPTIASGRHVRVETCDGSIPVYEELAPEPLRDGARYDIDIAKNSIKVTVVDGETGAPVADAAVTARVVTDDGAIVSTIEAHPTDASGATAVEMLPPGQLFEVCATATDRRHACSETVKAGATVEASGVTIRLRPKGRVAGQIDVTGVHSRLAIMSGSGDPIAWVVVDPEGRFTLREPPPPGAYAVSVSGRHPMAIVPNLHVADDRMVLTRATGAVRSVELRLGPAASSPVDLALRIGRFFVPQEALFFHQAGRGSSDSVAPSGSVVIADVVVPGDWCVAAVRRSSIVPRPVPAVRPSAPCVQVVAPTLTLD